MRHASEVVPFVSDADVERAIPVAMRQLAAGKVLAYPTETVYGLGGAIDARAIDALVALKGRTDDKPFLLLVDGPAMVDRLGLSVSPAARRLGDAFWPGPLTLVLTGGGSFPARLCGPGGGVAVRWTSHSAIRRLIAAHGAPITSTSANVPGGPAAQTAAGVASDWAEAMRRDELRVLDGGPLAPSPPSTVVDCSGGGAPRLVRVGAISLDALLGVVPELIVDAGTG
jgi:L-threonylcarbamoyladenylate synthase